MATMTGLLAEQFLGGDFPRGAQLIEGDVVVNDPTFVHQRAVSRMLVALCAWVGSGGGGEAGIGGNWVMGPATVLIPDVWWIDDAELLTGAASYQPPVLAIEVRSPSTWVFDVGLKLRTYERSGVREVWLIDTASRSVLVYRRSAPGLQEFDETFEIGEGPLTSPILPGFSIELEMLFAGTATR